jgi:hypothetical protein
MNPMMLGGIVSAVGQVADELFTSDKERLDAELENRRLGLEEKRIDQATDLAQIEVNKAEAQHASVFVAGGRPAAVWVCVAGLAFQFLLYPLLVWAWALAQALGWLPAGIPNPPALDVEMLLVVLGGLLGLGSFRTFEKVRGVAR